MRFLDQCHIFILPHFGVNFRGSGFPNIQINFFSVNQDFYVSGLSVVQSLCTVLALAVVLLRIRSSALGGFTLPGWSKMEAE